MGGRPKKLENANGITIYLDKETIDLIEKNRGDASDSDYVCDLLLRNAAAKDATIVRLTVEITGLEDALASLQELVEEHIEGGLKAEIAQKNGKATKAKPTEPDPMFL